MIKKSLKQLRKSLDNKEISVKELAQEYLERAQKSEFNALITVTEGEALSNAEAAQALIDSNGAAPLTGIPCVIKDNICTLGIKTTNGSKMLEDFVPFYDADLITTLKSQGYVLVGKANMDEFAMGNSNRTSAFGNVLNPHDMQRVAGGSSGGSAAAVAADLCCYSIATDTGGSIRQPSAHCGVVGLKPTYGTISRRGVTAFAGSFDTVGPIAKSVEDCAVVMEALTGHSFGAADMESFSVKGMKVAYIKEWLSDTVEPDVRTAVMNTLKHLEEQGADVTELSMPILDYAAPAYFCLASAEAVSALSRLDGIKYGLRGEGTTYDERLRDSRTRGFGDEVKRRIMLGNFVLSGDNMESHFTKALAIKQQIVREFDEVLSKADVIVSPTSMRTAFEITEPSDYVKIYSSTLYTVPMNLAGLPCVSVPAGEAGEMPVGVSVTGKRHDEKTILKVASCIERGQGL